MYFSRTSSRHSYRHPGFRFDRRCLHKSRTQSGMLAVGQYSRNFLLTSSIVVVICISDLCTSSPNSGPVLPALGDGPARRGPVLATRLQSVHHGLKPTHLLLNVLCPPVERESARQSKPRVPRCPRQAEPLLDLFRHYGVVRDSGGTTDLGQ